MKLTIRYLQQCTAIKRISQLRKLARYLPIFHVAKLAELKVQITAHLRSQFADGGAGLSSMFTAWKKLGPSYADHHYYFGKDGEYTRPLVDGVRVLRHVHLRPNPKSPFFPAWEDAWRRRGRKTSDDVLIYAQGTPRVGCLLIAVVLEPNGHNFAAMATPEDAAIMEGFASAADQFLFDGKIIV